MNETGMRVLSSLEVDGDVAEWQPFPAERLDGRPSVTIHYAQTLDGRIATRTGDSRWIGGDASLRLAHELRAVHDVVMVGIGTVLADNPRLTVRHVPGQSPCRVIVDSSLRIPLEANVVTDGAAATLIATTNLAPERRVRALRSQGVEIVVLGSDPEGHVDLRELFELLMARRLSSVLIEGGRALITSALRQRFVDRYVVCVSAMLVGTGIEAVGDLGIHRLSDAVTFDTARFVRLDHDLIFDGRLTRDTGREP